MNRADTSMLQVVADGDWALHNQRWLAQRFAGLCERLASDDATASVDQPPLAPLSSASDATIGPGFEPAASRLACAFGLSGFETDLLVLAAGVEIDTPLRDAVARAQGAPPGQPVRVGFALASALLPDAHFDALAPLAPLRRWSLLQIDAGEALGITRLRIDERVLHCLIGTAGDDDRLRGIATLHRIGCFDGQAEHAPVNALATRIAGSLCGQPAPLVLVPNALDDAAHHRAGQRLASEVFGALGLQLLWVDAAALGADPREHAEIARRLDREAGLSGAGIAVGAAGDVASAAVARLAAALRSPLIVLGAPDAAQLAALVQTRPTLRFQLVVPRAALPDDLPLALQRAAAEALQQFEVEPALLEQALASVAAVDEAQVGAALWSVLREAARGGLGALAQRIDSRACLADLVVPPLVAMQLHEITVQLQQRRRVHDEWGFGATSRRGLGIAALFAGESGTGKTLAAEAIANAAGLDLYRIDLASVVSKYIGETEKNLGRVFEAAERSGAVLLFDEADALFGKRSEVKDSHDRYANIEVAYLLQRIESYRGLAILTSNLKSALDRAFLRRIRFVVQFPFPDATDRAELWRRQFPPQAPCDALDFAALGRLQLAGGSIRAVALNAAFHAAARGVPIGAASLDAALQAESAKLERPLGDARGMR
ncbi:MAG: ATP-binding protein [Burkholderiales bacterium]